PPQALRQLERLALGLGAEHVEAVVREVALEKLPGRRLRLGEQHGGVHAGEVSASLATRPDVLCGEIATNDLQPAGTDDAPKKPDPEGSREDEADEREEVDAEHERAVRGEDADQARSDQSADDDQRDDAPV